MLKTLAGKHRSTATKMADKYQATIDTPAGPRVCFQTTVEREGRKPLVARFGGIPLKRRCCVCRSEGAFERVPTRSSDGGGELGERCGDAESAWGVDAEFVVAAAQVLHEGVSGDDRLGGAVGL